MKAYHVYPLNDLEEHNTDETPLFPNKETGKYCECKCLPREEWNNECLIIIHNSYDGREFLEQANEILNIKP